MRLPRFVRRLVAVPVCVAIAGTVSILPARATLPGAVTYGNPEDVPIAVAWAPVAEASPKVEGLSTAPATAASDVAPAGIQDCRMLVCLWTGQDYIGTMLNRHPVPPGLCANVGIRNSVYNLTNGTIRLWSSAGCTGQNQLVGPKTAISRISFMVKSMGGV